MTPSDIEFLIHCYVSPEPHPRRDAPAIKEAILKFMANGLITNIDDDGKHYKNYYRTTEWGEAHIKQMCSLPLPERVFLNREGNIIV